jgi:hypothetical protein
VNQPLLSVTGGPATGKIVPIDMKGVRIGRDPANEMHIDDPEVSRHHARVILHNGVVWVQDAGSRNGVFVNGARVSGNQQVSPGDQIVIGAHEFVVALEGFHTESSVSVNMDIADLRGMSPGAPPAASGGSRKMLVLAVVAVLVIGGVVVAVATGGGGGTTALGGEPAMKEEVSVSSLFNAAPASTEPDGPTVTGSAATQLAGQIIGGGRSSNEIPPPPEGATAKELTATADGLLNSQRLFDALIAYKQALQLDPECQICPLRIESISAKIEQDVQRSFSDGLRYQSSRQFREAERAFQTVLKLTKPGSEMFLQAEEGLKQIQDAM